MKRLRYICLALILFVPLSASALDPVGNHDLLIYANQDYQLDLTFKTDGVAEDLTGRSYKLQAKKTGAATPFVTFSSAITNAAAGQTRHWLTRNATRANINTAGNYDLMETAADGKVKYRMRGTLRIVETVTR